MKKLFLILTMIIATSVVNAKPTKTINYILTKSNPVLTFQLPSNPTTGYSWFLTSYDKSLLTLIKHQYFPVSAGKKDAKPLVGAGGYEVWQFKATQNALKAPQITYVKLIYARPWEIKADSLPTNIKTTTIYAVIKP
jgi:inhibitor of cysteine peptidase